MFNDLFQAGWFANHLDLVAVIATALLLQLLLIKTLSDGIKLLRSNLIVSGLLIVLSISSKILPTAGLLEASVLLQELATI